MKQYDAVVSRTMPALAREPESVDSDPDPSWSQEQAEAALFQRLTREEKMATGRRGADGDSAPKNLDRVPLTASQAVWRNVWTLYAAGILLFIALGVSAYQVGVHRGVKTATVTPSSNPTIPAALEEQVGDLGHERETLHVQIAQRDKDIVSLRHELDQQSVEMGRMKSAQSQLESDLQTRQAGRQAGSPSRAIRLEPKARV
jgi:hypothetical protein